MLHDRVSNRSDCLATEQMTDLWHERSATGGKTRMHRTHRPSNQYKWKKKRSRQCYLDVVICFSDNITVPLPRDRIVQRRMKLLGINEPDIFKSIIQAAKNSKSKEISEECQYIYTSVYIYYF